jgi:hypothetical protein
MKRKILIMILISLFQSCMASEPAPQTYPESFNKAFAKKTAIERKREQEKLEALVWIWLRKCKLPSKCKQSSTVELDIAEETVPDQPAKPTVRNLQQQRSDGVAHLARQALSGGRYVSGPMTACVVHPERKSPMQGLKGPNQQGQSHINL